jgi:hypothetical protein
MNIAPTSRNHPPTWLTIHVIGCPLTTKVAVVKAHPACFVCDIRHNESVTSNLVIDRPIRQIWFKRL